MHNTDIRNYATSRGVRLWQIAAALGITDSNFSRRLRFELSDDEKQRIRNIIDEIASK